MAVSEDFLPTLELGDKRVVVDRESGRVAFRIANWSDVHSGFDQKVRMPRDVNLDAAHVAKGVELEDGSTLDLATLPMHTTHAPKDLNAFHAASWYENTENGVARVRYSKDEQGIRADGVLFSDLDEAKLERLTAAAPSGDWRSALAVRKPQDFENTPADFVGACIVSIPGFSSTYSESAGQRFALAASAFSFISYEEGSVVSDTEAIAEDAALTAAAHDEKPADCAGACEGCRCSDAEREEAAAAAAADEGADDSEALTAAAVLIRKHAESQYAEVGEVVATLTANQFVGYEDEMDATGIHPMDRRLSILEQRLQELEQLVADSILSM